MKKILFIIALVISFSKAFTQTQQQLLTAAQQFPPMPRETVDLIPYVSGLPAFGSGTPFNDLEYTIMNFDYIDGENGGGDTFMPVNPSDAFPGSNTVKYIRTVLNTDLNDAYSTDNQDRIILGTAEIDVPFFSKGPDNIDNDYAVIQHFDYDFGRIQLRGSATDYQLLRADESDGVNTAGNYLFYTADFEETGSLDLIAFIFPCDDLQSNISGTPPEDFTSLCNTSQSLDLNNSNQFIYASPISEAPSIPQAIVQYGGTGKDVIGGFHADQQGNVYLMGNTDSDLTGNGNDDSEIFISKIDSSGNTSWVVEIPLQAGSLVFDAVNDDNYIYACGRTLDNLPGFTNAGRWDGFLLKIDINTGNLIASNQWGNSGIDGYGNIVLDNQGGLYVSGQGSPAGTEGTDDAYLVAKHNTSDLSNAWRVIQPTTATGFSASAEAWGGLYFKEGTTAAEDKLVAAGWYFTAGGANAFISVYENLYSNTPNRTHSIVFNAPGAEADWVLDNVIDSQGNIYVAGFTSGNLQGSHRGKGDAFIRKYSPALTPLQTYQFGTSESDMVRKMEIDSQDNLYLTGYTYGNLYGSNADISLETGDVFVVKLDSNLSLIESTQFGTPYEDRAYSAIVSDYLFIGGMTEGTVKNSTNGSFDGYALALNTSDLSITDPTLSTHTNPELSNLRLYPNPVSKRLYVQTTLEETYNYDIFDLKGRLIFKGTVEDSSFIDLEVLQSGTYLINLNNESESVTKKIIKN